jgi:hypothetical protein
LDIACFGDIHSGWEGVVENDKCKCINTGILIPQKIDERDIEPQFAIIEVDDNGDSEISFKTVPSRGEAMFNVVQVESKAAERAQAWDAAAERAKELRNETPQELVMRVGQASGFQPGTITAVIEKIEVRRQQA